MKISLITTISGRYMIVDAKDENSPLITFHNEFNEKLPKEIFDFICKKYSSNSVSSNITFNREFSIIDLDD